MLGYLIVGILISPILALLNVDVISIQRFAEFGVAANLRELFVATALMIMIGIALFMSLVGLSPAPGTFLAGGVLANSEYRHELESDIDPFKGLLLGLFFMTVGAGSNFGLWGANLGLIVGLTLGLMALKAAVLYVLAVVFKIEGSDRWLFALGLAQAGEFGFVLLSFSVANGVIPTELADRLLLVVALSMLLTPALFILFDRVIVPRFIATEEREADDMPDNDSKVFIIGHGRVGGLVSRILSGAGYNATVIDFNSVQLEMLKRFGVHAYYGDATRPDLLHAAGIADAKLFVIAIDGKDQITELVRYVHHHYPDLHMIARAVGRNHVHDLWFAGCRDIIREYYDSSLRMGRSALMVMGAGAPQAEAAVAAFNEADRDGMIAVAAVYDPNIPAYENEAFIARINEMREERTEMLRQKMLVALRAE